jgi:4-hydroxy-tetrahydrodipicolinate synthase
MYAIAKVLKLCDVDPPRPVLPLSDEVRQRVIAALDRLNDGFSN